MRSRKALRFTIPAAGTAAAITLAGFTPAPASKEVQPSESSAVHVTPPTAAPMPAPMLTSQSLQPIAVYAQAVETYHAQVAAAQEAAAAAAAQQAAPPPASTTTAPVTYGGDAYAAWSKVAWCEEGGTAAYKADGPWFYSGSVYPDSLGISKAAWLEYGGGSDVSEAAQIAVAQRLVTTLHAPIPDQGAVVGSSSRAGCSAW